MAPENIMLLIILTGATLYALFAGADFGVGVWEVNTALQSTEKERTFLYAAIGPVWEANHVWLIFVLVAMYGAFPLAMAAACKALWLPLSLVLMGIVSRGAGFAFRSYAVGAVRQQFAWAVVFAIGSTWAPFFLGASVGALASGRLDLTEQGQFDGNYLTGWLSGLPLFTGFFVVGMCAYLAAVYLAREACQSGDQDLTRLWRGRALATGTWMGVLALAGVAYMATDAPQLWEGFKARSWPLVGGSIVAGFFSLYSLAAARYRSAVLGSAAAVASVIWGWAVAQYPFIVPPSITIEETKAPDNVLWLLIATMGIGLAAVLPALIYLFYLFKSKQRILERSLASDSSPQRKSDKRAAQPAAQQPGTQQKTSSQAREK